MLFPLVVNLLVSCGMLLLAGWAREYVRKSKVRTAC
jgi:hypothetical protein